MPAAILTEAQRRLIIERLETQFAAAEIAAPVAAPAYAAPRPAPSRTVSPIRAARNRARLTAWIKARRAFAAAKADSDAVLMQWHDWLGGEMARLAQDEIPSHLLGLTAWDLSQAQITLIRPLAAAEAGAV